MFQVLRRRLWWHVRFIAQAFLQREFNDPRVQALVDERLAEIRRVSEKRHSKAANGSETADAPTLVERIVVIRALEPRVVPFGDYVDLLVERERLLARAERAEAAVDSELQRARHLAKHLFQMIPPEAWRDTGGDDGQGHYEGDYHAEQVAAEIRGWNS